MLGQLDINGCRIHWFGAIAGFSHQRLSAFAVRLARVCGSARVWRLASRPAKAGRYQPFPGIEDYELAHCSTSALCCGHKSSTAMAKNWPTWYGVRLGVIKFSACATVPGG